MNDMKDYVAVGRDLQKKCAMDTIDVVKRATGLCDNHAQATFVACGAVTGAAGAVAAHISERDCFTNMTSEELHDFTLFAAMFVWCIDNVNFRMEKDFPRTIKKWEVLTGRTFKIEWLNEPLAEIATGKYAKAV